MYPSFRDALKNRPWPLIGAHRGASGQFPENSLPAFEAAIRQGSDFLELDVRLSRDGVAVVIHDEIIDRTTGECGQVGELTAVQLERYGIPLLDTVLAMAAGKALFNIELKPESRPDSLCPDGAGSHRFSSSAAPGPAVLIRSRRLAARQGAKPRTAHRVAVRRQTAGPGGSRLPFAG